MNPEAPYNVPLTIDEYRKSTHLFRPRDILRITDSDEGFYVEDTIPPPGSPDDIEFLFPLADGERLYVEANPEA